ncbi:MAG: hypothetical protein IJV22_04740 [Bacteroidales bacterium]|nr:hypothetical protein [Bacteroidales bacterium]
MLHIHDDYSLNFYHLDTCDQVIRHRCLYQTLFNVNKQSLCLTVSRIAVYQFYKRYVPQQVLVFSRLNIPRRKYSNLVGKNALSLDSLLAMLISDSMILGTWGETRKALPMET